MKGRTGSSRINGCRPDILIDAARRHPALAGKVLKPGRLREVLAANKKSYEKINPVERKIILAMLADFNRKCKQPGPLFELEE